MWNPLVPTNVNFFTFLGKILMLYQLRRWNGFCWMGSICVKGRVVS